VKCNTTGAARRCDRALEDEAKARGWRVTADRDSGDYFEQWYGLESDLSRRLARVVGR
jgi:kynureninase